MLTESKYSPRRLEAAERQLQALELRKKGATFGTIAKVLHFHDAHHAQYSVQAALRRAALPVAQEYRALQLERLHSLLAGIWEKAQQGEHIALRDALEVLRQISSLLGLDAPLKQEISGPEGNPIEISAVILVQKLQSIINAKQAMLPLQSGETQQENTAK